MKQGVLVGVCATIIVAVVLLLCLGAGATAAKRSIVSECRNYGVFIINNIKYTCEKVSHD